jgi:hypothetical protein
MVKKHARPEKEIAQIPEEKIERQEEESDQSRLIIVFQEPAENDEKEYGQKKVFSQQEQAIRPSDKTEVGDEPMKNEEDRQQKKEERL